MAVNAPPQRQAGQSTNRSPQVNVLAATPQQIKSILLGDGWHDISQCEFVQFAIAPAMSPAQPNSLYSAITYRDQKSGKTVTTPLSKIISFDTSGSSS